MHGRPRKSAKEEDAEATAVKVSNLRWLQSKLLYYHHNSIYTDEAIELSSKLLQINPDFYTLWNYRKLAVQHKLKISSSHPDSFKSVIDLEFRAVDDALKLNFKSYGAWHHRRWLLGQIPHSFLDSEMRVLNQFQKLDPRNFHAWNHRRFVASLKNFDSGEEELEFTTAMIDANFSNYSAWHNRSVILSGLIEKKADGFHPEEKVFSSELDLVHQALFTDPDDQSGWFYYLWILRLILKSNIVVLLSSWPENGCRITPPPLPHLHHSISVPLVLHFSHVVEGVDLNTVRINSSIITDNNDIIWRPLSSISSRGSPSWGCVLNFPFSSSINHSIEITVGFSKGIVSVSGSEYTGPHIISFHVYVEPITVHLCMEESFQWSFFDSLKISDDSPKGVASFERSSVAGDEFKDTLTNEISLFRALLSEADCKFAKLSLARLLVKSDMVKGEGSTTHCVEEVSKLYEELIETDTLRSGCYRDEESLVVGGGIGGGRCGSNPTKHSIVMSGLSLSRLGGIGRMLWVEVLDLGRNNIRSIEGLESLQLLKCIDLSYNKIGSFSTLGPLAFSKSLRVLNVSHNEIGSHSVDPTRFLCASVMSYGRSSLAGEEEGRGCGYREACAVFKGMGLRRLDIEGNPISSLKLKGVLLDLLPNLEWIDGENMH